MGKFINPKKIKGQDKLNRIKDLMGKMNTLTESNSFAELELIKKGPNGVVYGIIRENRNYFIKTSEKTSGTFLSEDFNYVGGLQNKYDERYNSYAEAIKHLNMKFDMLNESFGIKENNSIFESDGSSPSGGITSGGLGFVDGPLNEDPHVGHFYIGEDKVPGDEDVEATNTQNVEVGDKQLIDEDPIGEQKKSVINVDLPAPPPVAAPVEDEVEVDEFATDDGGVEEFGAEEEIGVEEEGDDYTKKIQKLTGKVGQLLRDKDEPDPELDKYVINSVISAIDWEEVSDEDVEDIIAKIEGDEEEDEGDEGGFGDEEVDFEAEETVEEPPVEIAEEEIKDEDIVTEEDKEEKEGKEEEKEGGEKEDKGDKGVDFEDDEEARKHYLGAIADLTDKIADLDKDKEYDKKKEKELSESKTFTKKQLMESFLKKNANLALNKVLTENRAICEECLGGGCSSCEGGGVPTILDVGVDYEDAWTPNNQQIDIDLDEYPMEENLTEEEEFDTFDDWKRSSYYNDPESDPWDISRGGYDDTNKRYFDRHREKYGPFRIKPWKDSYAGTFGPDDNDLPWIDSKNRHLREDLNITNQTAELAGDDVHVAEQMDVKTAIATGQDYLYATGDLDRDGDKIPNRLDLDNNEDGSIDHGMGNKMYDWPEHILGRKGDRDSDGIPNKYDDDVDGDGRDDDYIEVGIDSIFADAPVKEPDIKEPITTPGTKPRKPRWKEITRPGVDPRPKASSDRKRASVRRRGMY